MFKNNSLTVAGETIIAWMLPFIFLGMMYSQLMTYVSVGIALIGLIALITGFFMKDRISDSVWVKDFLLDLGWPYAWILSYAIAYYAGVPVESWILWTGIGFGVLAIAANLVKLKQDTQ